MQQTCTQTYIWSVGTSCHLHIALRLIPLCYATLPSLICTLIMKIESTSITRNANTNMKSTHVRFATPHLNFSRGLSLFQTQIYPDM